MNLADLPLLEFIPRVSPEFDPPYHLKEWCDEFEAAARGELVRSLCAVPIRHWKTQVTLHGVVWLLCKDPSARYMVLSHSFERAQALGKRVRQLAKAAGVGPARGTDTISDWSTDQGGGVVIMSADQSRLGYDVHGLFFDDPLDENGALDPVKREEVDETINHYTARCQRRGKPGPVMGVMSRWHPDDPIGRRLVRTAVRWRYIHYPAVLNDGTPERKAFAENVWALKDLDQMRAELKETDPNERIWWAQLMGDPQPEGSDFFGPPTYYDELPTFPYRLGNGVDFAYVDAPGADFFAAAHSRIYGRKIYLIEIQRHKLDATLLETTCKRFLDTYGRAPMWSYQSGPEVGMSRMLIQRGIPIGIMKAKYNKLVRAQKTIRRWNDGDILVPRGGHWVPGFLRRATLFRGHDKDRDDEIDAVVSLADACLGGATAGQALGSSGSVRRPYPGLLG